MSLFGIIFMILSPPKAAAKLEHVITKLHQTHNIDCYDFGHTKAAAFV